jgi:DNA invertase Pin-like site-specific DNA recombinase
MNAHAYVRVSSASQSHAMQRDAIERAAKARGDRIARWHVDTWTGATSQRPGLTALRQLAREGGVPRLYVYRVDRLSRAGIRDTLEVVEELRACGVDLVTIADGFDLTGPASEVVLAVMAWAAKAERLAIGERIAAARRRRQADGQSWGRPSRLARADLARIEGLRAKGRSVRQIAVALKVPKSTVGRALAALEPEPSRKTTARAARPGPAKAGPKRGASR